MAASHTLSDLNRAAFAREAYWWINGVAILLSLVIAYMSVTAYADAGTPDKAILCVVCQVIAIACAILGRRALTAQMPVAGGVGLLLAAGCSWWAMHGLALAWARDGEEANGWMVFFLTALEPGMFLLAEHVREGRDTLRAAHKKAEEEEAEELKRIRARQDARDAEDAEARRAKAAAALPAAADAPTSNVLPYKPRPRRNGARGAAAAGAAAAALSGQAVGMPPADVDAPMTDATHTAMAHAGADPRVAHACALRDKGMFRAEVAAEMGVSESTITRLWSRANRAAAEALQGAA